MKKFLEKISDKLQNKVGVLFEITMYKIILFNLFVLIFSIQNLRATSLNDPPVLIINAGLNVLEGNSATISNNKLLVADVDNADNELIYTLEVIPVNGKLRLNGVNLAVGETFSQDDINNGGLTYKHNGSFTLSDAFDFNVSDGIEGNTINTTVFTIVITLVNDLPIASGDSLTTNEDISLDVDLHSLVSDEETLNSLLFFQVESPLNGSINLLPDNHTAQFVPNENFNGSAEFSYLVTDTGDPSNTVGPVKIHVSVNPINDIPAVSDTNVTIAENVSINIDLNNRITDIETADENLTFTINQVINGSVELLDGHEVSFTPNLNFNGNASFSYSVTDTGDSTALPIEVGPIQIDIIITPVNSTPQASSITVDINEDSLITIDLQTLVEDVETKDEDLIFTVSNASNGSVQLLEDGHSMRFTPNLNYNGTESFVYSVTDTGDGSAQAITVESIQININVNPVNDLPVIEGRSLNIDENEQVDVDLRTLVFDQETAVNDLLFEIIEEINGSVELFADGYTARFTPDSNFNGNAGFNYQVTDTGDGTAAPETVGPESIEISINPINDPPTASSIELIIDEDQAVDIDLDALVTDIETPDQDLIITIANSVNGTVVIQDGSHIAHFVPKSNFSGSARFIYSVTDTGDGNQPAISIGPFQISITIVPVNDAPIATGTTLNTNENIPIEVDLFPLVEDIETPDEYLTFSVGIPEKVLEAYINNTVNGIAELLDNNHTVRFTPNADFNGLGSFTYSVTDTGDGLSLPITTGPITINVAVAAINNAPNASATSIVTIEDNHTTVDLRTLVDDLETADNDLTFTVTNATNGVVALNDKYFAQFTPTSNYNGSGSFHYLVTDKGDGTSDPITIGPVTIDVTINPVNDPPQATGGSAIIQEDTQITFDLRLLVEDIETSKQDLFFTVLNSVNGTTILENEHFAHFSPVENFIGQAGFDYIVTDTGDGESAPITVGPVNISITINAVNDAPVAIADTVITDEDTSVDIDVLANDFDIDGSVITLAFASQGEHGLVGINAENQTLKYSPAANFYGTDSFFYNILDDNGAAGTGKVFVIINSVNDAPVAMADQDSTLENQAVTINVSKNDFDIDGTVVLSTIEFVDLPDHGVVSSNENGEILYTPNHGFFGTDSLKYTIKDNNNAVSNPALVSIYIKALNRKPIAVADTAFTNEDASVTFSLITNDSDSDGQIDRESISIVNPPSHGSVQKSVHGNIIYTPNKNYFGIDQFTYTINDNNQDTSNVATVLITVLPVDDPPGPFERLLPVDGIHIEENSVEFRWSAAGNVDNDTIKYKLTLIIEGAFKEITIIDTSLVINFNTLGIANGQPTVLWSVLASDGITTIGPTNSIGNFIVDITTAVNDQTAEIPTDFGLAQNYPNPFNPSTKIEYQLPQTVNVKIVIYNVYGQLVRTLVDKKSQPGYFKIEWNGLDNFGNKAASGIYIYRIEAKGTDTKLFTVTKKMMLLK